MKFVCERCHTRYSIADEKVRQKILRIRCKTCGEVIVIQEHSQAVAGTTTPSVVAAHPTHCSPPVPPPLPPATVPEWYVAISGVRLGPCTRTDAARHILTCKETDEVYVWKEGMAAWKTAHDVSVIVREVNVLRRATEPAHAPSHPPALPGPPPLPVASHAPRPSSEEKLSRTPAAKAHAELPLKEPTHPPMVKATSLPLPSFVPSESIDSPSLAIAPSSTVDSEASDGPLGDLLMFEDGRTEINTPVPAMPASLPENPTPVRKEVATVRLGKIIEPLGDAGKSTGPTPVVLPSPISLFPSASSASHVHPGAESGLSRLTGIAALAHRHQGLKYILAAGVIVVLLLVLVIITLRGNGKTKDGQGLSAAHSPTAGALRSEKEIAEAIDDLTAKKPSPVLKVAKAQTGKNGVPKNGTALTMKSITTDQRLAKKRYAEPVKELPRARPNPFTQSGVAQEQITAVVRNKTNQVALKSCYDRALKADGRLTSGRIDVTVAVGSSGIVQRVILSAPAGFYLLEQCLKNAVRRWVFPPSSEEYGASFPLIFQGEM